MRESKYFFALNFFKIARQLLKKRKYSSETFSDACFADAAIEYVGNFRRNESAVVVLARCCDSRAALGVP